MRMTRAWQPSAPFNSILANCDQAIRTILVPLLGGTSSMPGHRLRLWEAAVVLLGAIAVAAFILVPVAALVVVITCAVLWFLEMVGDALRGKIDRALLCWAGLFPLGYFALFPRERSIVTFERVVVLLAFLGLFFITRGTLMRTPKALRLAGSACLVFIVVAGLTLMKSPDPLNSTRTLFDSYVQPLLFGWLVIAWFDVRGRLAETHAAVCLSSIICAAIAAGEMITKEDLLPVGQSVMFYAGGFPRPNGPFAANDTLALVGGFSFFFLLFLRAALGPELSAGRRMLHAVGIAAALGMALMPMFRSVAITLLVVQLIEIFWEKEATRRAWRVAFMLACVGVILIAPLFVSQSMIEDRSSRENAYGRLAQFEQNLQVFLDHPVVGVGYLNFHDYVVGEPRYVSKYEGVSSLDWPHNNLAEALAETGLLGFVPYVLMHALLFSAMWKLRKQSPSAHLASKYLLYLFLTYWITGLTESSGHEFSNIWYAFAVIVIYKYSVTEPDSTQFGEGQVPDSIFNPSKSPSFVFLQ